jgi:assimilatory nitrate reductase catalytic subunit
LPAAGWGEKEGTFINSERRYGLVKKVARAPGQALSDFNILKLVAQYWGCGEMFRAWSSPEATFQIMKELSRGQPCDITAIRDYRMIDECGGVQWPWPAQPEGDGEDAAAPEVERRLFEDGRFFTPDERARFIFDPPRAVEEPVDATFPLILLTGRGTSSQWHTQTRTGKSDVLRKLYPAHIYLEISPADAEQLGVGDHAPAEISSRRGKIVVTAVITNTVQPGQVFLPMHYAAANQLTHPSFDPHSRQPSYKSCAVAVAPLPDDHPGSWG